MSHNPQTGIDTAAYRRCLGQFATGVAVVTAADAGSGPAGLTINSFSSVSLDPPLVLWSLRHSSQSFASFSQADAFCINILAARQLQLSRQFGVSGSTTKFAGVSWRPGHGGAPVLADVVASFECSMENRVEAGDHLIFIGRVRRFSDDGGEPLLFVQGQYGVPSDHPDLVSGPLGRSSTNDGPLNRFMSALMYRAYARLSAALSDARKALGLTHMEARLLTAIETYPGETLDQLAPELLLGSNAGRHVLGALMKRGLVAADGAGVLSLTTDGQACFQELLARCAAIESDVLAAADATDVAATQRTLQAIISSF